MWNGYSSAHAANIDGLYAPALESFLRATADPQPRLERLLKMEPGFTGALVLRAGIAVAAKTARALKDLRSALEAAARIESTIAAADRAHLEAAHAWLQGCPLLAAERYSQIVRQTPHDLLALRLAQSCWFFLGRSVAMRDIAVQALRAWSSDLPGYDIALALAAFGHVEAGDFATAETLARQSLDIEPRSAIATHAFAHALGGQKRFAEGARWMRDHRSDWAGGRMQLHNEWHLALFDLRVGSPRLAAQAFEASILPAVIAGASDPVDATSLLWHLQQSGMTDASRWPLLAQLWDNCLSTGFWPFLDVLAAITYANAGDRARLHRHVQRVATIARGESCAARLAQAASVPILQALVSSGSSARPRWSRAALEMMGASRGQRELLEQMLSTAHRLQVPVRISQRAAA